jgi:multiple sugar transport system permease protein
MIRRRNIFCYLMVAPTVLLVLLLGIYPMLQSIRMSFLQYDLMRVQREGTPFVGLRNFQEVFANPRFTQSILNTFLFVIIVIGGVLFLGLMIAQLLNMQFRGRGTLRTLILIPWVTPPVVAAAIWMWMYQTERSPINQILRAFGIIQLNIRFLTDAANRLGPISIPMLSVSSVRIWNGLPFVTIMILAGLQSIPVELYEAGQIDGAGVFARFRYITLPMLRPVLAILITLLSLSAFGHFEVNYIMTGGGPQNLTNIMAVMAYQQAFVLYRFDLGSAMTTVILLITSVIAAIYIRSRVKELV